MAATERKFEYKIFHMSSGGEKARQNDEMMFNSLGVVGWELVAVHERLSPPRAYFKREVTTHKENHEDAV